MDYYVDKDIIRDENGKVQKPGIVNTILDLAYIKDGVNGKFGPDFIKNHKLDDNRYILRNGDIYNIKTLSYEPKEQPKVVKA